MVEVQGEDGVVAGVPGLGGDGEVDDDVAFDRLIGVDTRLTQEERRGLGGGEFRQSGEAGVEVSKLGVLDGAGGGRKAAVRGDEGCGDVLEEERKAEAIGDADGDERVEIVLRGIGADDVGL